MIDERESRKPKAESPIWTDAAHPLWRWLLLACALANVVPLWSASHLPFTDLPQHVAAIATLRHWFDPAWKAQQYFTLALSQTTYLLYYLAGALLAFPLGSAERANLVLLSLIALSFPYALRALLRAVCADERLALFAAPLFWSQTLLIGFFNYLAALPLVLWALSLAVLQAEQPTRRRAVVLALAALGLFYLHLSAFLFFAPAAVLATWLLPRPAPAARALFLAALQLPNRLLWMLPSAAAALLFLLKSPVMNPQSVGWQGQRHIDFESLGQALRNLPSALLDIWRGDWDEATLLALIGGLVLVSWPGHRDDDDPGGLRTFRRGIVLTWVLWAWALYFFFPRQIGWLWQLNERYAILAALLVPALLRPARGLRGAVPLLLVAAVAMFGAGNARAKIQRFDLEAGDFDALLARTLPGRRMIGLIYDYGSTVAEFGPFLHYASYYRARYGGLTSFSFAELPQSPIRYRPELAPPPHPEGWEWHPQVYRNDVDGLYYDYVLTRGAGARPPPGSGGPVFSVLAQSGAWTIWSKDAR